MDRHDVRLFIVAIVIAIGIFFVADDLSTYLFAGSMLFVSVACVLFVLHKNKGTKK